MTTAPVVVGVLSHKDPPQVQRLVRRLLEGRDTVVVSHHDPRGPELDLPIDDRVMVVGDAAPADWGRMGVVDAQLRTLDFAHRRVPDLGWFLLVSGQDYPCRSMRQVEAALRATDRDAFVRHFRADGDPADDVHHWQATTRRRYLRRRRLPGTHRSVPFPRRHPFRGATNLYVGDLWVNLGHRAVERVMHQRQSRRDLVDYLATCSVPDEAVLPTLLLNHADGLVVEAEDRRFLQWTSGSPHPDTLGVEHVQAISASTDFFARKFDPGAEALDRLDRLARGDEPATTDQR